jgi:hypothetical protein
MQFNKINIRWIDVDMLEEIVKHKEVVALGMFFGNPLNQALDQH